MSLPEYPIRSPGNVSGSNIKVNGSGNLKDPNCSRSSIREMSINKLTSPSPSIIGNTKIFEKCISETKRTPNMSEKFPSSIRYEKVELVSCKEVVKPRDGNCTEFDTLNRMKCDSLSYKERMGSGASKAKVSGSHKKQSAINIEARKKVKGKFVKSHLSCSKRRRVENTEQGNKLHNVFPVQDGKESITELNMDQTADYTSDVLEKEPQFEIITGDGHNVCVTCMLGGKLLSCVGKGCKRKYHPSCLVPSFSNDPLGFWHCIWCVKKKKQLGVHSVSEVMSILDAREAVSDSKAMQREKQYLVKYRGLAHVHNRWIPEKELLSEARTLVTEYSKNQVVRWKPEWTIPNRLLQKRKLLFPTNPDGNNLDCIYEWLVKWTGLGYEQATWELESSSFLTSPESMKLIRDFEFRHQKSERLSSYSEEEEKEKCSGSDLSKLSFGGSPRDYGRYLSVNKLLVHWRKNQNAVVYDDQVDQERVIKVILFVLSLQSTARRPFLIISKSTTLSVWESEFLHVASSANIIVYKGSKNVRSSIRSFEFYNEIGSIMFEILLSASDMVAEDLDKLKCIRWGTIVIDECQRPGVCKYFEQFKSLRADMKLLLVSGEIKERSVDYQNMLSLLDSGYELSIGSETIDYDINVCKLKEKFAHYFAFECKSSSPTFVEYWVPVQLSYLQLEQYCDTLLSNSRLISSSLKKYDALRELVISFRKCCDHPYLFDQSFQGIATKGLSAVEVLNIGIKVSGKLQILDKILLETKARGLRVLIIFQSVGGSGRDSVGNILDDFLCQRFGKYSHVRVDGGGYGGSNGSKKKASINTFNSKESGRQFLLLEDRACFSSIKLSAVDVVVLFNSDCKPQNDMKALHRISISSQFEQLKVFRLYSAFTVEENFLFLAKNGTSLDSNIQTLGRNSCHKLLSRGASYLFNKLDDFHGSTKSVSVSNVSCEQSFLNAVFSELLTQLPRGGESNHSGKCNFITEVPQNVVYDGNISLFGEKEIDFVSYESSVSSLIKLLEGMPVPQWKLLSKSSTRNRKKVQYFDSSPTKSKSRDGVVIKKGQITINGLDDPTYPEWKFKGKRNTPVANKKRKLTVGSYSASKKISPCSTDGTKDVNKSNQLLLKLGISKLCEVLLLPENVRGIAVAFLQYIMQDYDVSCESGSSMQAYQISLCWRAADLLEHKLNHQESLALAKQHLNLDFRDDEVEYIYSELQSVAKKFAQCSKEMKAYKKSNCTKSVRNNPQCTTPPTLSASPQHPDESLTENTLSSLRTKTTVIELESDTEELDCPSDQPKSNCLKSVRNNPQYTTPPTPSTSPQDPDAENTLSSSRMKTTVIELESDSEELDCPSDQPKDRAIVSDSQEHQSPTRMPVAKSVEEPSEIPQAQCNAAATCNDRTITTNATQSNKESVETDALISERATFSKAGQHDSAVTRPPGDSNASEFIGTVDSLVDTYVKSIESNSLLCQEPACSNPLKIELERIQKFKEQTSKLRVDKILRLKSERDKEIEEIHKKYDSLLKDAEMSFKQMEQDLESYCSKVKSNDLLAESLMFSQSTEVAGSPVMEQLIQQSALMLDPRFDPSLTSLGAPPPPGQISNHSLPAVAPESGSATHVAQSSPVVIRAAAPHLRAPDPRIVSYSHGVMLHQLSEIPGFNSYVSPLEEYVDISNHAGPDQQIS